MLRSLFIVLLCLMVSMASAQETRIRIMAANITSGNNQSYDPGHGTRIFQGLKPDVVAIQEFNVGDNSSNAIRQWVNTAFGSNYSYYREGGAQIPNGVISRFPILDAGEWDDAYVSNRDHAWARLDIPGDKDLWVVSVHFLTSSAGVRNSQAQQLKGYIQQNVPAGDYLTISGDFNTGSFSESAFATLSSIVYTGNPYPADQYGKTGTNASRAKPYDQVLLSPNLRALQVPVVIGNSSYPNGLVFDSRVYSPLSEVAPVQSGDSGSTNMQHMAVVKDVKVGGTTSGGSTGGGSTGGGSTGGGSTGGGSTGGGSTGGGSTGGGSYSGSLSANQWQYYTVNVPAGTTTLKITMTGSGDADLYVRKAGQPSKTSYDYRPYEDGSNEEVIVNNPASGTWYIGVNGYASNSSYSLNISLVAGSSGGGSTGGGSTGGSTGGAQTLLSQSSVTVDKGKWVNFQVNVPAGKSKMTVSMNGSGDGDLYVRQGSSYPTTSSYDFRPYLDGSNESVVVTTSTMPALTSGNYWISVYGYTAATISLTVVVE